MVNQGRNRKNLQAGDGIKVTYNPSPADQPIGEARKGRPGASKQRAVKLPEVTMKARLLLVSVLVMAIPVFAHHGGTSLYDMSKVVTTQATVTDFQWTNPHVEIGLDAKDSSGKVKHWILEANSPPVMVNKGWNRKSLAAGDVIKASFNPSQRGGSVGRLIKLTKADGTELGGSSISESGDR